MEKKVIMKINVDLKALFTNEEVEIFLQQKTHLKSSRLDGFNLNFYKKFWHIVGDEISLVVLNFLNDCIFYSCINFTYIVLIPKIKCHVRPFDFQLLACVVLFTS